MKGISWLMSSNDNRVEHRWSWVAQGSSCTVCVQITGCCVQMGSVLFTVYWLICHLITSPHPPTCLLRGQLTETCLSNVNTQRHVFRTCQLRGPEIFYKCKEASTINVTELNVFVCFVFMSDLCQVQQQLNVSQTWRRSTPWRPSR